MKIKEVACVGAGLVGQGWATLFAVKGLPVNLQSRREETIRRAMTNISSNLKLLENKGLISREETEVAIKRVKTTTNLSEAVREAGYIQESIIEDIGAKKKVFSQIDMEARSEAIIASSSSSLLMSEIQKSASKPERCLIVHPFYPAHLIPLVELVPGNRTSQETVEKAYEFMLNIGKVPVMAKKEVPGHVVNRLVHVLFREAVDLVDKEVATIEDIDRAFTAGPGLRFAIVGPFLTYHLGGGPGGIDEFFDKYWTDWPASIKEKVIKGIKEEEILRTKSMKDLVRWRDEKLIELLKILYPETVGSWK